MRKQERIKLNLTHLQNSEQMCKGKKETSQKSSKSLGAPGGINSVENTGEEAEHRHETGVENEMEIEF